MTATQPVQGRRGRNVKIGALSQKWCFGKDGACPHQQNKVQKD